MTPLVLSAGYRLLRDTVPMLVPTFSVLISVSHPDGMPVTGLPASSFYFGMFPSSDEEFGLGIRGVVTNKFQDYSKTQNQNAPGFYGLVLGYDGGFPPYGPFLFVTVTEYKLRVVGSPPTKAPKSKREAVAQGQIVIGNAEDNNNYS